MDKTYWQQQTIDKPLFSDLLWSRPENKRQAGKLGIVGGNAFGFVAPAEAFTAAERAGIGSVRMLLPDSMRQFVGPAFTGGDLAPTTPSGSFSRKALVDVLQLGQWGDGLLIAGDLGRNSETAILLEELATKYSGQLTITQDAIDYFTKSPQTLLARPETLLVLSFAQLQKLATSAHFPQAFAFDMDLMRLVEQLHNFTAQHQVAIIVKHLNNLIIAVGGQVSSTKLVEDLKVWRVITAAKAATWWLQNAEQPFQALTTSIVSN